MQFRFWFVSRWSAFSDDNFSGGYEYNNIKEEGTAWSVGYFLWTSIEALLCVEHDSLLKLTIFHRLSLEDTAPCSSASFN